MEYGIRYFICVLLVSLSGGWSYLTSQHVLTEMDHDAHHVYDRMIILTGGGDPMLHSSLKPYWRHDLVTLADSFSLWTLDEAEKYQVQSIWDQNNEFVRPSESISQAPVHYHDSSRTFYYLGDGHAKRYRYSRKPLWNTFYRTPAHFYQVDVEDFYLRVNPMIRVALGKETEEGVTTFINQRGINLRGGVGRNVFFQTAVYESQVRFPNYINQYTDSLGVVPGVGFYKEFKSAFFDFDHGRDFLLANAYAGINLGKHIGFQLGHNQHFIGDGIRSLLLSDYSTPYFSLKINTRVWKLHYQNIFAELAADNFRSVSGFSGAIPKKYMAAHYLSFKPNRKITLGLFETVVFNRPGRQFELQYLNPVILYRTVEGSIGSPDNVLLGLNARVDAGYSISFYGQFVLDDIHIRNIIDGHMDWWGNKFGHQLGMKYINAIGVRRLDLQVEWNQVRPYTFSHYDENANYSNYKQPMAHPLGANFNEWIVSLRYQATPKLQFQSAVYLIGTGEDMDSISFGSNVIVPNTQRPGDFGHSVGQGIETDIFFWSTRVAFEWTPGVFLDGLFAFRKKTSALPQRDLQTQLFQVGVRYNITRREEIF